MVTELSRISSSASRSRSEAHPELDGAWFRAFDFKRWEYFGSNADAGAPGASRAAGPGRVDSHRARSPATQGQPLELTAHSAIAKHMDKIRPAMLPDDVLAAAPQTKRVRHDAIGSTVLSMTPSDPRFYSKGKAGLVDGELVTADWGCAWLVFVQRDFEAVIDLGKDIPIKQLGLTCMQQVFHGMICPTEVEFAVSTDNLTFTPAGTAKPDVPPEVAGPFSQSLPTPAPEGTHGRYVRVHAHNRAIIPRAWKAPAAKPGSWWTKFSRQPRRPARGGWLMV